MFKLALYGLAGYGGYMLYMQYVSKEIECGNPRKGAQTIL